MSKFFITGVQRSGTTLLAVLLERHPDILLEERSIAFRFVSCFKSLYDILPFNLKVDQNEFLEWLVENDDRGRLAAILKSKSISSHQNIRDFIRHSIDQNLKESGKKIWGDKSPNLEYFLSDMMLLMPEAKFIHIVRDGRAVALSMSKRSSRNLLFSAQKWADGNIFGLVNQRIIGKNQYKIIRYEDLLSDPELVMQSVCDFLELPYASSMLDLQASIGDDGQSYVKNYFDQTKIHQWKNVLSPKEIEKIEQIQGPILEQLGYQLQYKTSHRPLSVWRRIRYNQADNIRQLFRTKREGMVNRKKVDITIPFKNRVYIFLKVLSQDLMSMPIFKTLFSRVYYREKYYPRERRSNPSSTYEFDQSTSDQP